MKRLILIALILTMGTLSAQEYVTLKGRITDSRTRKAVPYAAVLLQGTNTGTQSNDAGEYKLKVENGKWKEGDMVLFSAMGYKRLAVSIDHLVRNGNVSLDPHALQLHEVEVTGYVTPQEIIAEAICRIPQNYHVDTTIGTWFQRDYRLLNGDLYLFDESVVDMLRYGYVHDSIKRFYHFTDTIRELDDNYKMVRKHRLLVCDSLAVALAAGDMKEAMAPMDYSDNNAISDVVATPQANWLTAARLIKNHKYDPIQEYTDADGTEYWLLRAYGRNNGRKVKCHYTLRIRKDNFAIVEASSEIDPATASADYPYILQTQKPWSKLTIHRTSTNERYELRGDRYTLTRYSFFYDATYYCHRHFGYELADSVQHRVESREWILTDLQPGDSSFVRLNPVQGPRKQNLIDAFGASSYDEDFWGQYNTLPLDSAIREKLEAFYPNIQNIQSTQNNPMVLNPEAKQDSLVALRAAKDTTPATIAPLPRWVFYRYGGIGGNRLKGGDGKSRRGISQQLGLGTRLHLGGRFHLYADLQYAWMHTKTDFGHLNTHSLTVPLRLSYDLIKPTPDLDCRLYVAVGGWGRYTFFGHVGNDTRVIGNDIDPWDTGWSWTIGMEFFRTFSLEWTSYRSLRTSMLDGSELFRHNGAFTLSVNF